MRGESENTVLRTLWRRGELANHLGEHVEFWILNAQLQHLSDGACAFFAGQNLRHVVADLRGEEAEPDFFDFGARGPKIQKFGQVAGPFHHLTGNRAMDGDALPGDVFQNAVVGSRGSADVMLRLQAVHGDGNMQVVETRPGGAHGPEGAGYQLNVNSALNQERNQQFEFPKANQRIATDDGQVQRLQAVDDFQNAVHESLAPAIVEVTQGLAAAEMCVVIRVASGTFQGTFAGDLDGKRRALTLEDLSPRLKNLISVHRMATFSDRCPNHGLQELRKAQDQKGSVLLTDRVLEKDRALR